MVYFLETLAPSCSAEGGDLIPQIILFSAQLLFGVAEAIYYVFGLAYLDDNSKRTRTPMMISISYFLKMLGPAVGFSLGSVCLAYYVVPNLTPTITKEDPRWIGAWWLGWPILGAVLAVFGTLMKQFPDKLTTEVPFEYKITENQILKTNQSSGTGRFRVKRVSNFNVGTDIKIKQLKPLENFDENDEKHQKMETNDNNLEKNIDSDKITPSGELQPFMEIDSTKQKSFDEQSEPEYLSESVNGATNFRPSKKDFKESLGRLLRNKILMLNNFSTVFYLFGGTSYFMFATKSTEIQYVISPSRASTLVGTYGLFFASAGVLLAGAVISIFKPRARILTGYNVFISTCSVIGFYVLYYVGCRASDHALTINPVPDDCHCEYVKYSPVCGSDGKTYISACHAGCTELLKSGASKLFYNCSLISTGKEDRGGNAAPGACPIDCNNELWLFLIIIYVKKFLGASGITSNFLVALRCVEKRDKPLSIGLMMTLTSVFAFIPGPFVMAYVMDKACLVWGKTCSTKGNCWAYDTQTMRFYTNIIAGTLVLIGTLLDCGVWYFSKGLNVFEEEEITNSVKLEENLEKKQSNVTK